MSNRQISSWGSKPPGLLNQSPLKVNLGGLFIVRFEVPSLQSIRRSHVGDYSHSITGGGKVNERPIFKSNMAMLSISDMVSLLIVVMN